MSSDSGLTGLIRDLVDQSTSLSTCLRKACVFAEFLDNKEFKDWVEAELLGYSNDADLPDYRTCEATPRGMFMVPGTKGSVEMAIARSKIPEAHRHTLTRIEFRGSIAELESLGSSEKSTLSSPWPPEAYPFAHPGITAAMFEIVCHSAWREIGVHRVAATVDSVRNRLLTFCVDLSKHDSHTTAESLLGHQPPQVEGGEVDRLMAVHITGDAHNIAFGEHAQQISAGKVVQGDVDALIGRLTELGVDEKALAELKKIVKPRGKAEGSGLPSKVASWAGKLTTTVLTEGAKVAVGEITKALFTFYGLRG